MTAPKVAEYPGSTKSYHFDGFGFVAWICCLVLCAAWLAFGVWIQTMGWPTAFLGLLITASGIGGCTFVLVLTHRFWFEPG